MRGVGPSGGSPRRSSWQRFDRAAERYEPWYASARARRVSRRETRLLARLLEDFPEARTVLDAGCGTGHFPPALAGRGLRPVGLDPAPAMLAALRRRLPGIPAVRIVRSSGPGPFPDPGRPIGRAIRRPDLVERALAWSGAPTRKGP